MFEQIIIHSKISLLRKLVSNKLVSECNVRNMELPDSKPQLEAPLYKSEVSTIIFRNMVSSLTYA